MKIKASRKEMTIDNLPLMFIASAVVCVVLRCIQIAKLIDAETGFYKESSIFNVLFYVFLFGSCLVFTAISYLSSQSSKIEIGAVKSKRLSVACGVFGAAMILDCIKSVLNIVSPYSDFTGLSANGGMKDMIAKGEFSAVFQAPFAFLSAVYFFILSSSFKSGNAKAGERRILALAPAGWASFRLMSLFVRKISFIRVSDLFLELVMLALAVLFFMAFAQTASGVYSEGFQWRIPAFGLSAALIAASISVSRLIFTFVDAEKYINTNHGFNIADFAFVIFAVLLIPAVVKAGGAKKAEEKTEETQEK